MRTVFAVGLGLTLSTILAVAHAQQPQIPTLQVCNVTKATGTAQVQIASRADPTHSGSFTIKVNLNCDPKNPGYPAGTVEMVGISMTDSAVQGTLVSTAIEQITSTGRATPTLYVNGRCKAPEVVGCRFWLMLVDNKPDKTDLKGTPDVVGFLVFNGIGLRLAYGTGPVVKGDIVVSPTSN